MSRPFNTRRVQVAPERLLSPAQISTGRNGYFAPFHSTNRLPAGREIIRVRWQPLGNYHLPAVNSRDLPGYAQAEPRAGQLPRFSQATLEEKVRDLNITLCQDQPGK